jgi:hypothetical protein
MAEVEVSLQIEKTINPNSLMVVMEVRVAASILVRVQELQVCMI